MRRSSAAWPVGWSGLARTGSSSSSPTTVSTAYPSEPNSGASPPDQLVQCGGVAGSDYSTEQSASSNGRAGKGSQLPHQVDSAHPLLEYTPLSVGLPAYSSTTSPRPLPRCRGALWPFWSSWSITNVATLSRAEAVFMITHHEDKAKYNRKRERNQRQTRVEY